MRAYIEQHGALKILQPVHSSPPSIEWDDEHYRGDAYGAYAWAVYVAEVSGRHADLRGARRRLRRGAGGRARHPSRARRGADRGRRGAGHRLGALRERRVARRADGQQADDQLHHADLGRHAAHPRPLLREPVRARPRAARRASASCRWTAPRPAILNAIEHATGVARQTTSRSCPRRLWMRSKASRSESQGER